MDGSLITLFVGVCTVVIIIQMNNINTMKSQIYKLNKTLEKIALQIGVEAIEYEDDEVALELVKDLLREGKKIEAIKKYRMITGLGLKDSKEQIDQLYVELMGE